MIQKVTCFITANISGDHFLLLFEHPTAGIQIPAGTVEEDESIENTALREASEESGLINLKIKKLICSRDENLSAGKVVLANQERVFARPDPTSFQWAYLPRAAIVDLIRSENVFAQVCYSEGNLYPDPNYISYQIIGWVRKDSLTRNLRRHFFHIEYQGPLDMGKWSVKIDSHLFTSAWYPFESLPAIVYPQNTWLDYVCNECGYDFKAY